MSDEKPIIWHTDQHGRRYRIDEWGRAMFGCHVEPILPKEVKDVVLADAERLPIGTDDAQKMLGLPADGAYRTAANKYMAALEIIRRLLRLRRAVEEQAAIPPVEGDEHDEGFHACAKEMLNIVAPAGQDPAYRTCRDCGREFIDVGDNRCPKCNSDNTEIQTEDDEG